MNKMLFLKKKKLKRDKNIFYTCMKIYYYHFIKRPRRQDTIQRRFMYPGKKKETFTLLSKRKKLFQYLIGFY